MASKRSTRGGYKTCNKCGVLLTPYDNWRRCDVRAKIYYCAECSKQVKTIADTGLMV